jgi:hypothetical protein
VLLSLKDWANTKEEKTARNLENENLVGMGAGTFHGTENEGGRFNERFEKDVRRRPIKR